MLIIYIACFQLSAKDKATMLKSLSEEKNRQIIQNLEYLDEGLVDRDSAKFKRRGAEMSNNDFIEYQRQRAASEFEILRSEPLICKLLKEMHHGILDTAKYPYVEPPKEKKKAGKEKKLAKGADTYNNFGEDGKGQEQDAGLLDNPRLFVFVMGGLSHHEMCSISQL